MQYTILATAALTIAATSGWTVPAFAQQQVEETPEAAEQLERTIEERRDREESAADLANELREQRAEARAEHGQWLEERESYADWLAERRARLEARPRHYPGYYDPYYYERYPYYERPTYYYEGPAFYSNYDRFIDRPPVRNNTERYQYGWW